MKSNGFTLVELLIGVVIATLCMLMMLSLFKQTTQIGIASSHDAEYDAQIQIGLLVAQKFIQNAGYGSGLSNDIILVSSTSIPTLYWRFIPLISQTPITYKCQGIVEKIVSDHSTYLHRLVLIKKNCGSTTDWQTGTWEEDQTLATIRSSKSDPIFQYSLAAQNCTPYGIDNNNAKGLKQLTISAQREHITGTVTGSTVKNTVCLNNILNV